jgi:uncharacterized lipoprotein YbaY
MALSGIEQFIVFGFVPLLIGMFVGRPKTTSLVSSVAGRLVLPPCDPLPADVRVTIELVEQRRGESVWPALAVETTSWHGGGIQDFALRIDRAAIDPLAFYALRARLEDRGETLFETRHPELLAPLSGGRTTLLLMPVGC